MKPKKWNRAIVFIFSLLCLFNLSFTSYALTNAEIINQAAADINAYVNSQGLSIYYWTAHRGASEFAPENTMPAYKIACKAHANHVETDVRMSSNGVLVCHHDPTINGYTISNTSWSVLSTIPISSSITYKGQAYSTLYMPSFNTYCYLMSQYPNVMAKIELIHWSGMNMQNYCQKVYNSINSHDIAHKCMV